MVAMWFPAVPVGVAGDAIAVAGALLAAYELKGWKRVVAVAFFVVLGVVEYESIKQAEHTHSIETQRQHDDVEHVRADLQRSETLREVDNAYLRAKVEDYSQFGPALIKLAQTAAEFERKQYETRVQTNKELYDFTMTVVDKIRAFSARNAALTQQQSQEWMEIWGSKKTDAEKQQAARVFQRKEIANSLNRDSEFRSSILPDAIYARNELRKRHIPEPQLEEMNKSEADLALTGIMAGARPEFSLALYLEQMARGLKH